MRRRRVVMGTLFVILAVFGGPGTALKGGRSRPRGSGSCPWRELQGPAPSPRFQTSCDLESGCEDQPGRGTSLDGHARLVQGRETGVDGGPVVSAGLAQSVRDLGCSQAATTAHVSQEPEDIPGRRDALPRRFSISSGISEDRGTRWLARYRDDTGHEHAQRFDRKVDAQRWIDDATAALISGQYVDPRAGRETLSVYYAAWSQRQIWAPNTRRAMDLAA